ncbi:MAG: hypothetical protein Q4G05_00770 [Clostridia bacterium]|nr:hypothetical protein [Clostridia bacterium]
MDLINKITQKATETYKNTTHTASKFAKEAKLKMVISENKGKIEDIYEEIGKNIYEAHIREEEINVEEIIKEECSKIDALAKEIEDLRQEILKLKDLKQCKKCAYELDLEYSYCPKCGQKMDEEVELEKL